MSFSPDRIPKEHIQLMVQAGFIAINHGWYAKAKTIFMGVRSFRPRSELPSIGLTMIFIAQGKLDDALLLLGEEEAFFVQNHSCYHRILKAIIFRLANRFSEALQELTGSDVSESEYASLVQVLVEDIKSRALS